MEDGWVFAGNFGPLGVNFPPVLLDSVYQLLHDGLS